MRAQDRRGGPERTVMTVGLLLLTLAGVGVFIVGIAGSLSFFGQGADGQFKRWAVQTLSLGGGAGALAGICGIAILRLTGRPGPRRLGAVAVAVAGIIALIAGTAGYRERLAPERTERGSLDRLVVPARSGAARITTGSIPAGAATVAGSPGQGPPVGVSSWRPADCGSLHQALEAWADRGSVTVPKSFVSGPFSPACLWFATYRGWSVRAEVIKAAAGQPATARVIIAPPGVGL